MGRNSATKKIVNEEKFDENIDQYIRAIEKLEMAYDVSYDKSFSDLVNFHKNKSTPKHSWLEYKEGYASNLVSEILTQNDLSKDHNVLDPFCGVGTTNVVAQQLGYNSFGFDVNPLAVFTANVKTQQYFEKDLKEIQQRIDDFQIDEADNINKTAIVIQNSFSSNIFEQFSYIKGFYKSIENEKVKNFFKLAFLSIVEDCSYRKKDGNGLKTIKNKDYIKNAIDYFLLKSKKMLKDLQGEKFGSAKSKIYLDSFNNGASKLNQNIGLTIFSPPYANCFDYCEVYKLELWMGDFVEKYSDFKPFRELALRSHVNSKFDHKISYNYKTVSLISKLLESYNLWNKNIPDMIKGYFDDMTLVLKHVYDKTIDNGKCYIIVANSSYKGIVVPTDLLFAEIAEKCGFVVNKITEARKMRSSSQQMLDEKKGFDHLMRESIIELQK